MDIVDDRYPQLRARSTGPLRVQELALLLAELGGMEAFMGVGVSPPPSGTTEEHADDGDVRRDGEGKWTTSSNKGGGGESAETEGELEGADAGDSAMGEHAILSCCC